MTQRVIWKKVLDDSQGLLFGSFSASLGFVFLNTAGLLAGQTAGMAIILTKLAGISFGEAFFLVNLPFYVIGWFGAGRGFVLRTFLCVSAVSGLTELIPHAMSFEMLQPGIAGLAYGVTTGLGLLGLIRHGGSFGGVGMAALVIQERWKIRAGMVQLMVDAAVFAIGLLLFPVITIIYSFFGAIILNSVIAWNHIPGRYRAG